MACDRRHRLPSLVRDSNTTLYRGNAEDRMEFSNVPANSYLSGNLPSSIAPP